MCIFARQRLLCGSLRIRWSLNCWHRLCSHGTMECHHSLSKFQKESNFNPPFVSSNERNQNFHVDCLWFHIFICDPYLGWLIMREMNGSFLWRSNDKIAEGFNSMVSSIEKGRKSWCYEWWWWGLKARMWTWKWWWCYHFKGNLFGWVFGLRKREGGRAWLGKYLCFVPFWRKCLNLEATNNMCPKDKEQKECPFYWTVFFTKVSSNCYYSWWQK